MIQTIQLPLIILPFLVAISPATLFAQVCDHCRGTGDCQKVCRVVVDEKTEKVDCLGCKSETFCLPSPTLFGCKQCNASGTKCQCDNSAAKLFDRMTRMSPLGWLDSHTRIYHRKKMVKREATKTTPVYKCVIENLCEQCREHVEEQDKK